jgi:hypothetical protein
MFAYVAISATAAVVAGSMVSQQDWSNNRAALLVAFGIQGAAILTRLGRGYPISDTNHLTKEQVDRLNVAIESVALEQHRAARVTFFATLLTIGATGIDIALTSTLTKAANVFPSWANAINQCNQYVWPSVVTVASFLIATAFLHLPSILRQDIALIKLQAQFKAEAAEKAKTKSASEKAEAHRTFTVLSEIQHLLEEPSKSAGPQFGEIRHSKPEN